MVGARRSPAVIGSSPSRNSPHANSSDNHRVRAFFSNVNPVKRHRVRKAGIPYEVRSRSRAMIAAERPPRTINTNVYVPR